MKYRIEEYEDHFKVAKQVTVITDAPLKWTDREYLKTNPKQQTKKTKEWRTTKMDMFDIHGLRFKTKAKAQNRSKTRIQ